MHALLIDGLNLIRRIHAALTVDDAEATGERLIESCAASLQRALRRHQPTHAVVVLDGEGPGWRHELYPPYKADRPPMPADLAVRIPAIESRFHELGVRTLARPGFEADDVLATIAHKIRDAGGAVTIVSTDRLLCQLLAEGVAVYDHFADRPLDEAYVEQRFGVPPGKLADAFALAGDTSVNVPGVRSIGIHTAAKLLSDYDSLEKILDAAGDMRGNVGAKLRSGREDAMLAARLFRLRADVEVGVNLRDLRYPPA